MSCDGSCCSAFYLPLTRTDLRRDRHPETGNGILDVEFTRDMVIPLTPKEANERAQRFATRPDEVRYTWANRGHHYACRHWDEDTRRCTAYAERPHFCRAYPNQVEGAGRCAWGCDEPGTPMEQAVEEARAAREPAAA